MVHKNCKHFISQMFCAIQYDNVTMVIVTIGTPSQRFYILTELATY